jgi:hypothetical protein
MAVVEESALRILIPRRNVHRLERWATRSQIHLAIARLRAERREPAKD